MDNRSPGCQPGRWIDKDGVIRDGVVREFALREDVRWVVIAPRRPPRKVVEGVSELVVERVLDVGRVGG